MREKRILMDIDHTLSDAFWRDPMLADAGKDGYEAYHLASEGDKPIAETAELAFSLRLAGYEVIGLTTRPERWRTLTLSWLLRNGINLDGVLMRPNNDYRPTPEVKLMLAISNFPNLKRQVSFIIDDREDVCNAFRNVGVHALQMLAAKGD